ncbi:hypothetical protein IEQ34_014916 [Dendrobium chrysotoxum]|uniref:Uncharacterized protein n=1 Tax=Dendrobium chrysotoxum TaxID=161865 RepID=A0AAV7GNI3_DENCH|nr:hypothetical protein IEQ34_027032 [Dendrobium chrysotoxum]KAH0457009.1 hypothetical protein IEQ34_014916 [Dendrobium chrysotoxum]
MSGDHLPSKNPAIRGDPIASYDCEWGPNKETRVNETASTVTSDFLILFLKNFHFPNDVVTIVPKRSDRARLPPPGYLTVSETNLRAGLRFPPSTELIKILRRCGVNISQFSFKVMSVTVGLIVLFRDRGATMKPEHLSRMGQFISDTHGRVTFRSKWLDLYTHDPLKNWANAFFFMKNDWVLLEKWGKMNDLSSPLHVEEEDIMRILKVPDIEHLLFEVRHMSRYIEEEFLFKDQKASKEKIASLEAKDKRSQTLIAKKEAALSGSEPSKLSRPSSRITFRRLKTISMIFYDIEMKALEQQYIEDEFIRGFLKGVRLMQRKTGVQVEGVTPSQASDDFPSGSDGDEIESELQKAFDLDVDDETVNIE